MKQLEQAGAVLPLQLLLSALEAECMGRPDLERAQTLLKEAAPAAGVKKGVLMKSLQGCLARSPCRGQTS